MLGAGNLATEASAATDYKETGNPEGFLNIASAVSTVLHWMSTNAPKTRSESAFKGPQVAGERGPSVMETVSCQNAHCQRLRNRITTQSVQSLTALVNAMAERKASDGEALMPPPQQGTSGQQKLRATSSASPSSPLSPRSPRTYLATPAFVEPAPVDSL
jgi:hypothetical protein